MLRTEDAISPIGATQVLVSLVLFLLVYAIIFLAGIVYINRLLEKGPLGAPKRTPGDGLPNRPLSAAHDGRNVLTGE